MGGKPTMTKPELTFKEWKSQLFDLALEEFPNVDNDVFFSTMVRICQIDTVKVMWEYGYTPDEALFESRSYLKYFFRQEDK